LVINPTGIERMPLSPKDRFNSIPHSPMNINYNPSSQVNPFRYHDNAHPFNDHAYSEETLATVQSDEVKKQLVQLANEVFVHNRKLQDELMDRMTSHELLSGLLFPGEEIINIPPMILSEVQFDDVNEFKVLALQTNYRLILMKVDAACVGKLQHTKVNEVVVRESYKVSSILMDGIWYYPIPMRSLTGVSLEVKLESGTESVIEWKRRSWVLLLCVVGIVLGLSNFVEIVNTTQHILYITVPVGFAIFFGGFGDILSAAHFLQIQSQVAFFYENASGEDWLHGSSDTEANRGEMVFGTFISSSGRQIFHHDASEKRAATERNDFSATPGRAKANISHVM